MIDRIKRINAAMPDSFALCEFAGQSEAEAMVFQTLRASEANHATCGDAFSFKSTKLREVTGGGLGDNPAGYQILLDRGWIEERNVVHLGYDDTERVGGAAVGIFPTGGLLIALERHLGTQG